ncbi:HEPN domain-containing protein [Bradyrhizobium sp. AZCC 2289]|uniref:ApeA N-terminal domain 1-containing protein n=1 Tax=Bradyrhizobium sp. AZCC 2289 TaxID=3117026 RepID=UPI002FF0EBFB
MDDFRSNPRHGRWWDINEPKKKFNGTLKVDEDDCAELVIRGKESNFVLSDRPADLTTLWGHLTSEPMRSVSVFGARPTRGPSKTYPPKKERETEVAFSASYVLSGAHVETLKDPFIDRVLFGLSGLEEWCNAAGFSGKVDRPQVSPPPPKGNLASVSVNISFQASSTPFFDIGGGRRLRLLSLYRGPEYFGHEKQFELKEKNKIEIVFPKRVSIEQALEEVRIWQTFISFGLRIPTFLEDIVIVKKRGKLFQQMSLFVPERKWEVPRRRPYHRLGLFNQSKLGPNIGLRLKEWRERQDTIDMTVLLFRGARYLNDVYIHTNTLTYLQALEVFHRQMYKGDKFPNAATRKTTLKALRKAIPKDLDETLQRELEVGLSFVGSPSLLERLKCLFHRYPTCLKPLFPGGDEDMALLKNARNFLTHYGDIGGLTKEFMSSREVFVLGEKARLFLEVCLLGVMGMTDDEIVALLKDFEPYVDWCRETKLEPSDAKVAARAG